MSHLPEPIAGGAAERGLVPADVIDLVYAQIHAIAEAELRRERAGHTLQPTALVHEAYLRLAGSSAHFRDEAHFLAVAAQTIRRVLVDHARERGTLKRGGEARRISLQSGLLSEHRPEVDVLALDRLLDTLQALDPRKREVVEMKFFAGLSEAKIAEVLGVDVKTVERDWKFARAFIAKELRSKGHAT